MRRAKADGGVGRGPGGPPHHFGWRFVFALILGASSFDAQMTTSRVQMTYQDRNQVDYGPLRVGVAKGRVRDDAGVAIPSVCLGLFSEPDHKLVATTQTDVKGAFRFRHVASSRYRIVAKYEGFCPANAILLVQPTARRSLRIHMKPAAIDTCSYVE
jgi:hypothetical protein